MEQRKYKTKQEVLIRGQDILWDYHLPEVKSKYYTENFLGEISKLTKQMHAEFFREERIFTRQYENDRRKMETDFLAEIS